MRNELGRSFDYNADGDLSYGFMGPKWGRNKGLISRMIEVQLNLATRIRSNDANRSNDIDASGPIYLGFLNNWKLFYEYRTRHKR